MRIGKRKGLSPIIAELLLLAITVSIGTTFYLVGSSKVSAYTGGLSLVLGQNSDAAQEIYVVEYAEFVSGVPHSVEVTVRNVGFIETELAGLSIFNLTGTAGATSARFDSSSMQVVAGSCTAMGGQVTIPVQAFCTVRMQFDWSHGTAYNFVLSTARGNRMVVQEIG